MDQLPFTSAPWTAWYGGKSVSIIGSYYLKWVYKCEFYR